MEVVESVCTPHDIILADCLGNKMELSLRIRKELGAPMAEGQHVDVMVSQVLKQIFSG